MFYSTLLRVSVIAGSLLALSSGGYGATTSTPPPHTFPPVGLASTETAQINVANVAVASSSGTAPSCSGTISFVDASGNTIGTASSFTLASGATFSASLPYAETGASARAVIRGVIQLTAPSSSSAPCALDSSLEIYDSGTGVTHVVLTAGPPRGFGGPGFGPPGGAH